MMQKQSGKTQEQHAPKAVFNKLSRAANWTGSFLIFPASLGKLAAFWVCSVAIGPLTGALFPNAGDYLAKHGHNPAIAEELSGKGSYINVREFNTAAFYAHEAVKKPNIILWGLAANYARTVNGYAEYGVPGTYHRYTSPVIGCRITVPERNKNDAGITDSFGISRAQQKDFTLFHEIRHCHPDNQVMTEFMKETDADYEGALKTAESHQDPDLLTRFMMARANYLEDKGYNSSLYFDAKINNEPLPTETQMRTANNYLKDSLESGCLVINQDLPELAMRRIQLFFNAADLRPAADKPQEAPDIAETTSPRRHDQEDLSSEHKKTATKPADRKEKATLHIVITESAQFCPSPKTPAPKRPGNS